MLGTEYMKNRGFCHNENFELQAVQYNAEITRISVSCSLSIDSDTQLPEKKSSISLDSQSL